MHRPDFHGRQSCVFTCAYYYVPSLLEKKPFVREALRGNSFQTVIIRRANAAERLKQELRSCRKSDADCVIYGSPLVDVAATLELARETTEICLEILNETRWQIRLLSKSPLLVHVARTIPSSFKHRVIYGLSTGTLDDCLAGAIEPDAPPPSKRLAALKQLQGAGFRTYAMLCPVLPFATEAKENRAAADAFLVKAKRLINFEACEHVWAEALNEKGRTFDRVQEALLSRAETVVQMGKQEEALKLRTAIDWLEAVKEDQAWEDYARTLFNALAQGLPPGKLRFLQYPSKGTADWWIARKPLGAIPLIREPGAIQDQGPSSAAEAERKRKRREAAHRAWKTIRAKQAGRAAASKPVSG